MKKDRPICPECMKPTIVLFTPPKENADYKDIESPDYVDWNRAHLYCCNGETNCTYTAMIMSANTDKKLTTP